MISRMLLYIYINQRVCVKWSETLSKDITVSNGIKQGGVLSPKLFNVYIDVLLQRLSSSGRGCHIGNVFVGAIGYADDIVLLSPSVSSLKKMLNICQENLIIVKVS